MTEPEQPIQFPHYQPPGIPVADHKQAGPLTKAISKMLPKRLMMKKGIQSKQTIKVGHKGRKKQPHYY